MRKIAYLYGSQPIALDQQKLATLHGMKDVEVHLVFWDRIDSSLRLPFSIDMPAGQLHVLQRPNVAGCKLSRLIRRSQVVLWFVRKLREIRPRVVHACSVDMLFAAWIASRTLPGMRIVFDLQDTPDWMWDRRTHQLQRILYRSVAQVMVTSPRFESHFLRVFRLVRPTCPVLFVPNAPWKALFTGFEAPEPGGEMTVACIGGLREEGPIRCLLGAIDLLQGEGLGVRLFYAGVGPYRSILDDAARTRSYLTSHGGFEYHRDIRKLYQNAHFVFACYRRAPDRRIHLACRFADAMNCGVPVIVGSDTYMAELAMRHNVGLVANPEDTESLANVLRPVLIDPDRWRALARNAHLLRDEHTFDVYVSAFLSVYRRLLADEGR